MLRELQLSSRTGPEAGEAGAAEAKRPRRMRPPLVVWSADSDAHRNLFNEFAIERPERLQGVLRRLRTDGLLQRSTALPATPATDQELAKVVSPAVLEELRRCSGSGLKEEELELASSCFEDVFVCRETLGAVRGSAGAALTALRRLLSPGSEERVGLALCRPPGHHASLKDGPCGFCWANNAALAACVAREELGAKRVLLLDWDVHAGHGSQAQTLADADVLFVSIHRYEEGRFWPNLRSSDWDTLGSGPAAGRNVNVPLNGRGFGDAEYLAVFLTLVLPLAREFRPDVILVSCGLDAALGDPEGEMAVGPAAFAQMTQLLKGLGAPVLLLLEGGYFQPALEECSAWLLRALLDEPVPQLPEPLAAPARPVAQTLLNLFSALSPHWESMAAQLRRFGEVRAGRGLSPALPEAKAVYRGVRDFALPYPTRGDYLPRPAQVDEDFAAKLRSLVDSYKDLTLTLCLPSNDHMLTLLSDAL